MKKQHGLTGVELLIVLIIVGILAAVVIPNVLGLLNRTHEGNETEVTPTPAPIISWFNCSDCTWHIWQVGSEAKPYDTFYESIYSKETGTMLWVGVKGNCMPYDCEEEECCPCEGLQ